MAAVHYGNYAINDASSIGQGSLTNWDRCPDQSIYNYNALVNLLCRSMFISSYNGDGQLSPMCTFLSVSGFFSPLILAALLISAFTCFTLHHTCRHIRLAWRDYKKANNGNRGKNNSDQLTSTQSIVKKLE